MAKTAKKTEIRVTLDIKPVRLAEVTPAQLALHKKFWTRLISQVKSEVEGGQQNRRRK